MGSVDGQSFGWLFQARRVVPDTNTIKRRYSGLLFRSERVLESPRDATHRVTLRERGISSARFSGSTGSISFERTRERTGFGGTCRSSLRRCWRAEGTPQGGDLFPARAQIFYLCSPALRLVEASGCTAGLLAKLASHFDRTGCTAGCGARCAAWQLVTAVCAGSFSVRSGLRRTPRIRSIVFCVEIQQASRPR